MAISLNFLAPLITPPKPNPVPAAVQTNTPPTGASQLNTPSGTEANNTTPPTDQGSSTQQSTTETPQDAPIAPVQAETAPAATQPSRASAQSVVIAQTNTPAQAGATQQTGYAAGSGVTGLTANATLNGSLTFDDVDVSEDAARAMAEAYSANARQQAIISAISEKPEVADIGAPRAEAESRTAASDPYARAEDAVFTKPVSANSASPVLDKVA